MKSYSYNDLRDISIRISKNINRSIQRNNNIHNSFKQYFNENSVAFVDKNGKFVGTTLNETSMDNLDLFNKMSKKVYIENINMINNIVNDAIKHEGMNNIFELKCLNNGYDKITCGNEKMNRFKNLYIGLRESSAVSDIERKFIEDQKKDNHYADYQIKKYYKVPNNIAQSTTNDLIKELEVERDKQHRINPNVMGNPNDPKNINSSHYDYSDFNHNSSDIDYHE